VHFYVWHSWICKGFTCEEGLGQCQKDSHVRRRFVVGTCVNVESHIEEN
jgi:hypothetical protein